jgi:superfamily II DNA or RNA helicase
MPQGITPMSRNQLVLEELFQDQFYGPKNGFEPREFQTECLGRFVTDVTRFKEAFPDGQHRFCIYGGTGTGKTKLAGLLSSYLLNTKLGDQIVYVCPNRSIRRKAHKDLMHCFGIDLVVFNARKHRDGIPRTKQGYILTYSHLINDPTLHRRISTITPAVVIFDEIHHLGDASEWGAAAKEAFDRAPFVIALTGTPYRSDNTIIPFVTYEDVDEYGIVRFHADYTYSLGSAVADGVCRKPLFVFHSGVVKIRTDLDAGELEVSFEDTNVNDAISSLRLRGAVKYGSEPRKEMLRIALEQIRAEGRKVVIFLGGDTEGDQTPREDAINLLPTELNAMGISQNEYWVVTGEDKDSQNKIEKFGASEAWILISINMISEGTDIPEVSAEIFLTSVTAKQTTVQRIGRALRLMGPDDRFTDALIFMFEDPTLKELASEIEHEIKQEIDLRKKRKETDPQCGGEQMRHRAEAIGVSGGEIKTIKFHGHEYPAETFETARAEVRETGLPATMLNAVLKLMMWR